jgi:thymidine phosphorylase
LTVARPLVVYVAGLATDLCDGLAQAREVVASGAATAKLEEWVAAQAGGVEQRAAGEARLTALRAQAGLPA